MSEQQPKEQYRGQLWIVASPSGGGKTSLVKAAINELPDLIRSVSFTTREQRVGEVDGKDYVFVEKDKFQSLIEAGEMLEYEEVFGNFYGTSLTFINTHLSAGTDVVLTIDWQGARQVRQLVPESLGVFILPPDIDTLEARLRLRKQDSDEVIAKRMAQAKNHIEHFDEFDYVIINDDFDRALIEMKSCIRAQRLRRVRQVHKHADLIARLLT